MAWRGLLFRAAMITSLLIFLATRSPGWLYLAMAFALATLAMFWVVRAVMVTLGVAS